MPKSRFSHNS